VIILNYANADMVGHTGKIPAAVKAIEALEECVPPVLEKVLEKGGQVLVTADHGNADEMLDEQGNVMTAHSKNPVPLVYVARDRKKLREGGRLCDLAPTILALLGLEKPGEMTGTSLIQE
jgi:2,3-bisphosphoglycerate-independent phosphoglycerate mutase